MEEKKWSKEKEELFNRWTKYHTKENRGIVGFQQSMEDVLDFILEEVDKAREEGYRKGAIDMFDELEMFPIPKDYLEEFVSKLKDNK